MREIVGNTIATPNPQPDWAQTDEKKADYIKNKPTLGALAAKDEVDKSDLSEEVQSALENADSALQSYTETDPTVPAWAKAETKPSYTASEIGALPITGGTLTGILRTSASTPLIIGNEGKIGMRAAPTDAVTGVNHVGQINISNAWWNTGEGEVQNQWGTQISGYNGKTGKYNELRVSHEGVQYNSEDGSVYQVLHSGNKGVANGVATLDADGHVPSTQLPSHNAFSKINVSILSADGKKAYSSLVAFSPTSEVYIDGSNVTFTRSDNTITVGVDAATTKISGIVQLKDSTSSTSTTTAATPNSVKKAYDLATSAHTLALGRASKNVATATTNGLMSATDKANLDMLVASAITVFSGTEEPTSDLGEDGDIYLVLEE